MAVFQIWQKIYKTFAALRTGIILLILTGVFSGVGTFILQRPTTDPDDLQRAYSPQTLLWLDRLGFTDVYHTWWFTVLLLLVCLSIIFASLERWPNAWRFYARPYRRPEPHFRAVLPHHTVVPISDAKQGLAAAERAFESLHLKPERIVDNNDVSLFAERSRFSVMAAYIIHASLLLIFAGWLIDYNVGYRGYLQLNQGQTGDTLEIRRAGATLEKKLGFAVRCDETGQENYADGTPKKWWSKLVVLDNGKEVKSKTIVVNGPLDYKGIRFYQAGFGRSSELQTLELMLSPDGQPSRTVSINVDGTPVEIDPGTTVRLGRYIPDYYIQDGEYHIKSRQLVNPAFELIVNKDGQNHPAWLTPRDARSTLAAGTPYMFSYSNLTTANWTGLEVSYQPGQWGVWLGSVLMVVGLFVAFSMVHMRFWAIAVKDEKLGLVLWVGGAFNKNRERFEERYKALVEAINREVDSTGKSANAKDKKDERATTLAGV